MPCSAASAPSNPERFRHAFAVRFDCSAAARRARAGGDGVRGGEFDRRDEGYFREMGGGGTSTVADVVRIEFDSGATSRARRTGERVRLSRRKMDGLFGGEATDR